MTIEKYRKIVTQDVEVNLIQDRLARILAQIADDAFSDRRRVAATLVSGSNRVFHGLKRQPKGWIVTDRDSAATVYRSSWNTESLTLVASAGCNIVLEVF
jgi:hypothetical protein